MRKMTSCSYGTRKFIALVLVISLIFTFSTYFGYADEEVGNDPLSAECEEAIPSDENDSESDEGEENAEDVSEDSEEPIPEEHQIVTPDPEPEKPLEALPEALETMEENARPFAAPKEIPLTIKNMVLKLNGVVLDPNDGPFEIKDGDRFELSLDWAVDYNGLPNSDPYIYDGDYAYVDVIDNMPIQGGTVTQNIMMNGKIIGTITLNPQKEDGSGVDLGKFKIVFNENIEGLLNVNGKINANTTIEYTESPGNAIIEDPYEEDVEYEFIFKPGVDDLANIKKTNPSYVENGSELEKINWQIDVNTKLVNEKGTQISDKLIFNQDEDNYLKHHFDESSVVVYPLTFNGSAWVEGPPLTLNAADGYTIEYFDEDGDGIKESFTITLKGEDPLNGQAYRVKYSTIPEDELNNDIDSTTYKNISSLENNSDSTAVFEWNTDIINSKRGEYVQDAYGNDYIIWTVYINRTNAVVPDPINISDILGPGLGEAYDFNLYEVVNDTVVGDNIWSTPPNAWVTDFENDADGFSMNLKGGIDPNTDAYYGYRLQYKTPVEDFDALDYSNTITVIDEDYDGIAPKPEGSGIEFNKYFEAIIEEATNGKSGVMHWTTHFDSYDTETKGLRLTDTFSFKNGDTTISGSGLKMTLVNDASFVVTVNGNTMTNVSGGSFSSPTALEYKIVDNEELGFVVVFNPDLDFRNTVLSLYYYTNYWLPDIDPDTGQAPWDVITYINTIEADFVGKTGELKSEDQTTIAPGALNNGSKDGVFAAGEDSSVITWTINANSNHVDLTGPGLTFLDLFPEPITTIGPDGPLLSNRVIFVEGSLEVYRVGADGSGGDQLLNHPADYTFDLIGDDPTIGFALDVLVPGNYEYKVVYKTQLYGNQINNTTNPADDNNPIATYKNVVKINDWRYIEATVVKPNEKMVDKKGAIVDPDGDNQLLGWEIVLNKSKSLLVGVSIIDTISQGQVLLGDSIKIYKGDTALADDSNLIDPSNYEIDIDDHSSQVGETVLKIVFSDDYVFDDAHVIKYQTYVDESTIGEPNPDGSYVLNNHIILKGGQIIYDEDSAEVIDKWTLISGSGKGEIIGLQVKKVSEEDPDETLEGAEFTIEKLSDASFTPLTVVSGADGLTEIKYLRIGEYTVTEVKPPDGYGFAAEKVKNVTLSIENLDDDSDEENKIITVTFENPKAVIACEVDKDTIRRTSAAYVSLPGKENINNVGSEQYRYDINFRSTSNVDAEQFWVDDPLENVALGQIRVDSVWTPIVWGDIDGKFDVYYRTKNDGSLRIWPGGANLDTGTRHRLNAPAGDLVTFVRYDYGEVAVGFTSKNGSSVSINGEHRDNNGNLDLPSDNANVIKPLTALQERNVGVVERFLSMLMGNGINTYATGIGPGGVVDWTPDPDSAHFALGALEASGLRPASYLVTALRQMENEDIVSSASSHIRLRDMSDQDQDAVVTKEIVTFETAPENIDVDGIVMEDSFLEDAKRQGFTIKGGKWSGPDTKAVKTGDNVLLGAWIVVMIAAAASIALILTISIKTTDRKRKSGGGGK